MESPPPTSDPRSPHPPDRVAAAGRHSGAQRLLPGPGGAPGANRLAALAAQLLGTTSAMVSLVSATATTVGSFGLPPGMDHRARPRDETLCGRTARGGRALSITDTREDVRAAGAAGVAEGFIGSFLGVPLTSDSRDVVGTLCVFDPQPRIWSQEDVRILEQLSDAVATELELAALMREYDDDRTRWDSAIQAAGIGNFDWDLTTGELVWDEPLIELFGYDGDEKFDRSIEAFNARLHPDDVPAVTLALQHAIDTIGLFEAEYRVVLPGGVTRRVQARGRATGNGTVADRVLGSAWDVSATRGAEERAADILEAMPVGYVGLSRQLVVASVNTLAEQVFGSHRTDLVGRTLAQVAPDNVADYLVTRCHEALSNGVAVETELFFAGADAWFEVRLWPDQDAVALYLTDVTERRRAQEAADRIAEYDRSTALALQEAMLSQLPPVEPLQISARYRTAASRAKVGGDWYDAVRQRDGATAVMVGDVTGHDIKAAAIMGQLRSMMRVLAWQGSETPSALLTRLDEAIAALHPGVLATVVAARIEQTGPDARLLRWSAAGHPPPLLVCADGKVQVLDGPGLMLGVDATVRRSERTVELPAGCTVVLYTDGLVETRSADIEQGIDRLAVSLQRHRALDLDAFLDNVLRDLVDDDPGDDVVILAVRLPLA